MYRARFYVPVEDYRPVVWPINHPYWCTGGTLDGHSVIVAYVDDMYQLLTYWPDAYDIDMGEEVVEYVFTDRFRKPDWFS